LKKFFVLAFVALLTLGAVAPTFAAAATDVAVVYNGQTEVNRETIKFLKRNLGDQGFTGNLVSVAAADTSSIKAGQYKAVVVLSTGQTSGLDPVLKTFINTYSAPAELFVVSLLKGSSSMDVTVGKLTASGTTVDAVTAASAWSEGAEKMTYIQLHQKWVTALTSFLKKR